MTPTLAMTGDAWVAVLIWVCTFLLVVWGVNRFLDWLERRWQRRHVLDDVNRHDRARAAMRRWHER